MLQYKVVELGNVSEDSIEEALNEWTGKGWHLDTVQFAMRESSKRPAMAFLIFTSEVA
jgi:hypothetical protein